MSDPAPVFFKDPHYDGQLVRSLSAVYAGAADLGEVFATARAITEPSRLIWHTAWTRVAQAAWEPG